MSAIPASLISWRSPSRNIAQHSCSKTQHDNLFFDCHRIRSKMVCTKCQRLQKKTELATPGVKRKSDLYFGSSASNDNSKSSATSTFSGIGKVGWAALRGLVLFSSLVDIFIQSKLLSKGATNPYAAYSSTCRTCKTKVQLKARKGRSSIATVAKQAIGRSRPQILQSMCLQNGQRYVSIWLLAAAPTQSNELTLPFSLRHLWQDSRQEHRV